MIREDVNEGEGWDGEDKYDGNRWNGWIDGWWISGRWREEGNWRKWEWMWKRRREEDEWVKRWRKMIERGD